MIMKMVKHIDLAVVLAGLCLGGVGNVSAVSDKRAVQESVVPELSQATVSASISGEVVQGQRFSAEGVVAAMRRAADWQLGHPSKKSVLDWSYAPFWHGLHELSKLPGCEQYRAKVRDVGRLAQWKPIQTIHVANDHAVLQTWLDIGMLEKDEAILKSVREPLDRYMQKWSEEPGEPRYIHKGTKRWTWCDALYMSPPAYAGLYAATGDKRYLEFLDDGWWKLSDYLYDQGERLYFRDQTFFKKREKNGKKVFWCRGNGWVIGGLVRVLQRLPKEYPSRIRYENQFREMCGRLAELQQPDGLWRAGLLDQQAYPNPESSGSGLILYGLAYGVNEGLLERARFAPVIEKGWSALAGCLAPDGRLLYVQPVGDTPLAFDPNTTKPYGVGALLLAGGEVYRMMLPVISAEPPCFTVKPLDLVQTQVLPQVIIEKDPGHYFIDFGKDCFAALELQIETPEPGRQIKVHLGESLGGAGTVNRKPGGSVRYHCATVELKAGETLYRPALGKGDSRRMPVSIGPVMPFRYVELENAPSGLKAQNVRQLMVHYPFDDAAADFSCSDAKLNAVWSLCKHTIKASSFCGIFVDGDRERLPYEADAYINQLGWYACTTDTTLPRYSREYLIRKPTWPTEWILFSVLMAWEDYLYTGDTESVRKFYDDLCAKTLVDLARSDGLISTVEPPFPEEVGRKIHIGKIRDIVDWPGSERDGYKMLPVNAVVNAFHIRALQVMSKLAAAIDKQSDARRFSTAAERASETFNMKLFNQETGLYIDGEGATHSSLHANMFPLAFGLVPPERRRQVTTFVRSRGMACSVYGAQFLLEALFKNGEAEHALALITAPGDRSWRHMFEDVGATMTLEAWDAKYKGNLDWNHAWGAAPANILPRYVLGVRPLELGFAKALIAPSPGGLLKASGTVPTIRGPISIAFDNQAGGVFELRVTIPEKMSALVSLPVEPGADRVVIIDGSETNTVRVADRMEFSVAAGNHKIRSVRIEKGNTRN